MKLVSLIGQFNQLDCRQTHLRSTTLRVLAQVHWRTACRRNRGACAGRRTGRRRGFQSNRL